MSAARSVGEIIEELGIGNYHWRLLVIVGCVIAFAAVEILVISFVLPILIDQWHLSGLKAGLLGSGALIGMTAGNWAGGWYADLKGRIKAMQWAVVVYAVFTGLTALTTDFYSAFLLRCLTGIGVGASVTVAVTYLSEHLPTGYRGRFLVYAETFWPIGVVVIVAISWGILDTNIFNETLVNVSAWRVLFVICAFPLLFAAVIRYELGESPFYLTNTGQYEAAVDRLYEIAKLNNVQVKVNPQTIAETDADEESVDLFTLFDHTYRKRTVVVCLMWFGATFGFYGVFIWLPETLETATLGGNVYEQLFWVSVVQLPGILSATLLIDRIGRKATIGAYFFLAGIFILLFAGGLVGEYQALFITPFVALLLGSFFLIGAWGPMFAYTTELYPTELRGRGFGFASAVGRIASISGPVFVGALVSWSYFVALSPFGIGLIIAGFVVFGLGEETIDSVLE